MLYIEDYPLFIYERRKNIPFISNNLIKKCIIGMDILIICPSTKITIQNFQNIINECTHKLNDRQTNRNNSTIQQHIHRHTINNALVNNRENQALR